jgi:outer membrane protein TolC
VEQALWNARQAQWLWVPNLLAGPVADLGNSWIQTTKGHVATITNQGNRTLTGEAILSVSGSDALFGPLIANSDLQASTANQQTVTHQTQLQAALAYLDLVRAHGGLAINCDTLARAEQMLRRAETGGAADNRVPIFRARTEINLRRQERATLEGQAAEASAQLAQLLHLKPTVDLRPADPAVVPVTLVSPDLTLDDMVVVALRNRPELAESRAQVESALGQWRQGQFGPFLPLLQAGYTGGYFGSGPNDVISHFNTEGTTTVSLLWQLHSLGLGDRANALGKKAGYHKAQDHVVEVETQVASEVAFAAKQARIQKQVMESARKAVEEAMQWWQLEKDNLEKGDPGPGQGSLDLLVAGQTLAQARSQFLQIVIGYNQSQLKLFTALGQPPLNALPRVVPLPAGMPVVPDEQPHPEVRLLRPSSQEQK